MWSLVFGRKLLLFAKNYNRTSIIVRTFSLEAHAADNHSSASDSGIQNSEDNSYSFDITSNCIVRRVPLTAEDFKSRKHLLPVQPKNPHLLKVAIIGEPNVGKSTLVNSLVKWRICSVSKKVHTTRERATGILVEDNKQVIFLDTPGLVSLEHSKRHNLEASLVVDPERSASAADLIAVVIDASNKWKSKAISCDTLEMLEENKDKTSVLVLNKVDQIRQKKELLSITNILTNAYEKEDEVDESKENKSAMEALFKKTEIALSDCKTKEEIAMSPNIIAPEVSIKKGWSHFAHVFMTSALQGLGIDELREYMLSIAKPSPWMHHYSIVTDQHPYDIAKQIIRENLLNFLPEEIPYNLSFSITNWVVDSAGVLRLNVSIICPNNRHKSFVIGPSGSGISKCVQKSRQSLSDAFRCEVFLKLAVKQRS